MTRGRHRGRGEMAWSAESLSVTVDAWWRGVARRHQRRDSAAGACICRPSLCPTLLVVERTDPRYLVPMAETIRWMARAHAATRRGRCMCGAPACEEAPALRSVLFVSSPDCDPGARPLTARNRAPAPVPTPDAAARVRRYVLPASDAG
jgi:hypothetical protein